MLKLMKPSVEHEVRFKEMMEDYRIHNEDYFDDDYFTKNFCFEQYIRDMDELAQGIGLTDGRVPTTEWWLMNNEGDLIGTLRLRHYLTDYNRYEGGHIGYDISPRFRRQGFGTKMLRMALDKAREFGLTEVLLTCDYDNVASKKIIEGNGGKFENEIISEDSHKPVYRYWIRL